ncbi:metallophosphoesterase [Halobacillus sp. HZG1]|uniref:metallophosphoesterase n=1 Tax=Halobacillus sp. HZG1 TaxID=3111769 RepID=UPI002DBC3F79|nr:metallophosphoesterase [Halobacillus sp. HZG1]MEC3883035.1 metallophosphoesterase [Halobacillus sp. HZG1]
MKITRRTFIKRTLAGAAALIGLNAFGYTYARYMEPNMLAIRRHEIEHGKIPRHFHNFKVLQFSDTHVGFHYELDDLERLVEKINKEQADLILFTGDLVDEPHTYSFPPRLIQILKKLEAKHGKYWIYGNHDHGGYGTEKIREVMEQSGFQLLQNEHTLIKNGSASFTLAGVDDVMLGQPDLERTLENVPDDSFTLLMVHEPDVALEYQHYPVDVQLSGHSHGGQVQVPFLGYLVTPPFAEHFVEGHYPLVNDFNLYVSRGIGTTRLPYRFMCRPEFSVFHLISTQ